MTSKFAFPAVLRGPCAPDCPLLCALSRVTGKRVSCIMVFARPSNLASSRVCLGNIAGTEATVWCFRFGLGTWISVYFAEDIVNPGMWWPLVNLPICNLLFRVTQSSNSYVLSTYSIQHLIGAVSKPASLTLLELVRVWAGNSECRERDRQVHKVIIT